MARVSLTSVRTGCVELSPDCEEEGWPQSKPAPPVTSLGHFHHHILMSVQCSSLLSCHSGFQFDQFYQLTSLSAFTQQWYLFTHTVSISPGWQFFRHELTWSKTSCCSSSTSSTPTCSATCSSTTWATALWCKHLTCSLQSKSHAIPELAKTWCAATGSCSSSTRPSSQCCKPLACLL